jgi:hypothetical protein
MFINNRNGEKIIQNIESQNIEDTIINPLHTDDNNNTQFGYFVFIE